MLRALVALIVSIFAGESVAGVIIGGTRLVYDAGKREASIRVATPEGESLPYLIQSWVEVGEGRSEKSGFIITPPLFRLDPGQESAIRVVRMDDSLPRDRESLFWLNIKSIPASEQTEQNQLLIAVKSRLKLFYRPRDLPGTAVEAFRKLKYSTSAGSLLIDNPTPYYVTLISLRVNEEHRFEKPGIMIGPHEIYRFQLPAGVVVKQVGWKVVNDFGGTSEEAIQKF
ncbi:molecular chaperone [Pseudomonas knackmussii]|uniref:fimbrial biogenesis chaperone n=1 Tax=Pseudomonas knackmussii TaxID=65741 RepID=UPI003BBB4C27